MRWSHLLAIILSNMYIYLHVPTWFSMTIEHQRLGQKVASHNNFTNNCIGPNEHKDKIIPLLRLQTFCLSLSLFQTWQQQRRYTKSKLQAHFLATRIKWNKEHNTGLRGGQKLHIHPWPAYSSTTCRKMLKRSPRPPRGQALPGKLCRVHHLWTSRVCHMTQS